MKVRTAGIALLIVCAAVSLFAQTTTSSYRSTFTISGPADDPVVHGASAIYSTPKDKIQLFIARGISNDPYPTYIRVIIDGDSKRPPIDFFFFNERQVFEGVGTYVGHDDTANDFRIKLVSNTDCEHAAVSGQHSEGQVTVTQARYEELPAQGNGFHATALTFSFKYHCSAVPDSDLTTGTFTMTDASIAGSVPVTGPSDGGTGGGGGGTGGGTGGTPTPPPAPTTPVVTFADGFFDQPVGLFNGQSVAVPFSVFVPDGFSSDVTLSASSAPDSLGLTFDNNFFPAPGSGDAFLTISAGPDTFPIDRQVAITATFNDANGNPVSSSSTFTVSLDCNPPMILGVDQPKNASVSNGATAQVTVKPTGSGPFHYQWFAGSTGQVHFPVSGGTGATLTTAPVNAATPYWVRVSNACGSADSNTVVVSPK